MATTPPSLPHDTTRPPTCSWRGLLIDSARTFWPVPTMELLLTIMARYRFNVLHWHLTDNAGWRMHVPGYPMLTAIGGNIPRQPSDWYDTECAPDRKGSWRLTPAHSTQGFYSDANIRQLCSGTRYPHRPRNFHPLPRRSRDPRVSPPGKPRPRQ